MHKTDVLHLRVNFHIQVSARRLGPVLFVSEERPEPIVQVTGRRAISLSCFT